ncbi:hypothetical protein JL721_10606 [Aureococcus anophagefferens]|nr:hypothetical protein JL721_10606 [Aureococcus anophagefferens]
MGVRTVSRGRRGSDVAMSIPVFTATEDDYGDDEHMDDDEYAAFVKRAEKALGIKDDGAPKDDAPTAADAAAFQRRLRDEALAADEPSAEAAAAYQRDRARPLARSADEPSAEEAAAYQRAGPPRPRPTRS